MNCILCGIPVSGGLDTYGDIYYPVCFDCHWWNHEIEQVWYGVAPHVHNLKKTGSFIGSTELMDISHQLNENGEYDCGNGVYFRPDPDAPGCGVYRK